MSVLKQLVAMIALLARHFISCLHDSASVPGTCMLYVTTSRPWHLSEASSLLPHVWAPIRSLWGQSSSLCSLPVQFMSIMCIGKLLSVYTPSAAIAPVMHGQGGMLWHFFTYDFSLSYQVLKNQAVCRQRLHLGSARSHHRLFPRFHRHTLQSYHSPVLHFQPVYICHDRIHPSQYYWCAHCPPLPPLPYTLCIDTTVPI